jgi:transposase
LRIGDPWRSLFYFAKEGVSMARLLLTDEDWALISDVFPSPSATGRPRCDPRRVLNGILWVLRTGSPWRDLPGEFGTWKTAWRMFDQWNSDGTLDTILRRLQGSFATAGAIDQRLWCIDGTTVRAARCAGGGGKKATQPSLATMR